MESAHRGAHPPSSEKSASSTVVVASENTHSRPMVSFSGKPTLPMTLQKPSLESSPGQKRIEQILYLQGVTGRTVPLPSIALAERR